MVGEKIDALVSSGAGGGAKYIELAMRLLEEHEPERLVAALVSVMAEPRGQGSAVSSSYSLSSLDDDGPAREGTCAAQERMDSPTPEPSRAIQGSL